MRTKQTKECRIEQIRRHYLASDRTPADVLWAVEKLEEIRAGKD